MSDLNEHAEQAMQMDTRAFKSLTDRLGVSNHREVSQQFSGAHDMENSNITPLFAASAQQAQKTFAVPTGLTGKQLNAATAVSQNFINTVGVMIEGGVTQQNAEFAIGQLYAAYLATLHGVVVGWNGGKPTSY